MFHGIQFPYFNSQQLNLDWIVDKIKGMLNFLPDDGTAGQILRRTADGAEWSDEQQVSGGAVDSVNGKTGDVVLDAGDILMDSGSTVEDEVDDLKSAIEPLYTQTVTLTPTKINGLNVAHNGTAYANYPTQDAFYIPVVAGRHYTWATDKSAGNPYVRMAFSEQMPADGVPFSPYLGQKQISTEPAVFEYTPSVDGFLCESVYINQTNSDLMTITEKQDGELQKLESNIKDVETAVDIVNSKTITTAYGYSGEKIALTKNIMRVATLADIVDADNAMPSWTWAGGMAVYEKTLFSYWHQGYVAAFDLNSLAVVAQGRASDSSSANHCNCVSFDYQNTHGNYPLIYVSRGQAGGSECYVDALSVVGGSINSERIQTITYSGPLFDSSQILDWCVDVENRHLVMMTNGHIAIFALPDSESQTVALGDSDILEQFTYPSTWTQQDCSVYQGVLYMSTGLANEGMIYAISLANGEVKSSIDIAGTFSVEEPEGLCIYQNRILVNTLNAHGLSLHLFEITT